MTSVRVPPLPAAPRPEPGQVQTAGQLERVVPAVLRPMTTPVEIQAVIRTCGRHGWDITQALSEGQFGQVYLSCKRIPSAAVGGEDTTACDYVMKVQTDVNVSAYETVIQRRLQQTGVVPKVVDSFVCQGRGFLIMERVDGTLTRLMINKNLGDAAVPDDWEQQIIDLVMIMHQAGVLHNDLHPSNVMYKTNPDGSYRFYLVDLGLATVLNEPIPAHALEEVYSGRDNDDFLHWRGAGNEVISTNMRNQDMMMDNWITVWFYDPPPGDCILRRWSFKHDMGAEVKWPPRRLATVVDGDESVAYDVHAVEISSPEGSAYLAFSHPIGAFLSASAKHYSFENLYSFVLGHRNQWIIFDPQLTAQLALPASHMRIKTIEFLDNAKTLLGMGEDAIEPVTTIEGPLSADDIDRRMRRGARRRPRREAAVPAPPE